MEDPLIRIARHSIRVSGPLETPCLVCSIGTGRYARLKIRGKGDRPQPWRHVAVHRYVWEEAHGPTALNVLHRCDVPRCCELSHLFAGTQFDNMRDCVAKGRWAGGGCKGEAHGMAKLNEANVREIRARWAAGERQIDLAQEYGIHPEHVGAIVRRISWRHIE